ncbi:MAG: prolyl-tRNA synthetase associated domain-containing protein [Usitatibacter sp.]
MNLATPDALYQRLDALGITYDRTEHPPVYTCEEAEKVVPPLPGVRTKNLFLRDKKGRRHLLVVVSQEKRVDLRELGALLDAKGLMLASDERLLQHLGVTSGAVSVLAIANDHVGSVELVIDRDVWSAEALLAHPLVNTATLVIPRTGIERFVAASGHEARVIDLPRSL